MAKFSKFRRKTPDSGENFPVLDEKIQISTIIQVDLMRFWSNLAKSHRIWWDFCRIWQNLIESDEISSYLSFSHCFLAISSLFLTIFSDLWCRSTRPPPVEGLIRPIRLLWRSAMGGIFYHPIPLGRFWVGYKLDADQPVNNPNFYIEKQGGDLDHVYQEHIQKW